MKVVAPRIPTPVTPAGAFGSVRLPDDIVAEQVRRLELFGLVAAGMWLMGVVMDALVFPRVLGVTSSAATLAIECGAVALALAVVLYVRTSRSLAQSKACVLGAWLMVTNAAAIALLETWAQDPTPETMGRLSWVAVAILLSAMIMPGSPRKMLSAALVSASLAPLGVWAAHLRGVDVPSALGTLAMYMPNYACAVAAVMPSVMFQRMGRRLKEARDLGSYQLVDRLGQGGMGEVWRATHRLLAREAAVKLVRPEILSAVPGESQAQLRRFEREAQATAALTSPHTVRLFDFGATDDGSFYYVMELLAGRDLQSLVEECGPLPAARVMYLLRQACHSLGEAHAAGLVHRDVKPANIFVCRMGLDDDFVKVLDFGLVQCRSCDPTSLVTQTAVTAERLVGTPAYMAPEVILGGAVVDRRADVYALGCVAYFLLTGRRVFEEGTPMRALVDHVHTVPVPPSRYAPGPVPREVDDLVLACLEKDPARRPADALDLLRRIRVGGLDRGWSGGHARAWWEAHPGLLSDAPAYMPAALSAASTRAGRNGTLRSLAPVAS